MGTTTFTVTEYPSTVSTTGTWTDPGYIVSNNGVNASTTGTLGAVVELTTSNFGFNIPAYATITSIIAQIQHYSTSSTDGHAKFYVSLCHNGVSKRTRTITDMQSTVTTTSLTLNAEEVALVSIAELNSDLIQVVIGVEKLSGTETYYFDYASIIVGYTVPSETVPSETVLVNGYTLIDTDWVYPGSVYASGDGAMNWTSLATDTSQSIWLNIPDMNIPDGSTIISADAIISAQISSAESMNAEYDLYYNSSLIDSHQAVLGLTRVYQTLSASNYSTLPSLTQCNSGNLRIRFKIIQGNKPLCTYYIDYIALRVLYSVPAGNVYVNIGGTWKLGTAYVNVGGVWKQAVVSANIGEVWKS